MIYNVELEGPDGKTYIAELDGPDNMPNHIADIEKNKTKDIDVLGSLKEGAKAAISPNPQQIGQSGLDVAQRFGQATLGSLYGQGRQAMQQMAPQGLTQPLGQGMASMLPGGAMTANALSPRMQQEIGKQGVGAMVDVGAGLSTEGSLMLGRGIAGAGKAVGKSTLTAIGEVTGANKLKGLTNTAFKALNDIERNFSAQYKDMFSKIGNKFIPNELKENIGSVIDDALSKATPDSPFTKYLSNLKSRMGGINGQELHALKQELGNRSVTIGANKHSIGEVYDAISDTLSNKKVYGSQYEDLTRSYKSYLTKEKPYIEDLVLDKFDNPEQSVILKKRGLDSNYYDALRRISVRAGLKDDLSKIAKSSLVKRGVVKLLERYGPASALGAGEVGVGYGIGRYMSQ